MEKRQDIISRRDAIDALKGLPTWWADEGGYYGGAQPPMVALLDPEDAVSAIENLPSAQPEREKGEWNRYYRTHSRDTFVCNKCGSCFVVLQGEDKMNFCPNCGADMRGEQE